MKPLLLLVAVGVTLVACDKAPTVTQLPTDEKLPRPAPKQEVAVVEAPPSLEDSAHFAQGGDGKLHVYFLDVGHGDATLVVSPVGKTVLIDAGPKEAGSRLVHRLPELLDEPLDMLVLTRPHQDHYGGIPAVVKAVGAKRFLDARLPSNDETYASILADMKARKIPVFVPAPDPRLPGDPLRIKLGGGADLVVFWPRLPSESLIDAAERTSQVNSLVMRVEFGETSLLLASDAQMETERLLLKRRLPFLSTMLRVGSHGGEGASTFEFLSAVRPLAAIISVGAGNAEGMPSSAVNDRLERAGARVFRTDLDGDVEAWSDGKQFALSVERPPAGEPVGTEYLFQRDAPTKSWVNPNAAKSKRSNEGAAEAKPVKRDTSVTMDLSDGAGSGSAAKSQKVAAVTPKGEESFKKVVEVDSSSLIPDAVKAKYSPRGTGKSTYVASRNAKVFHFQNCSNAKRIKKENLVTFASRTDASKKFKPAGDCNP